MLIKKHDYVPNKQLASMLRDQAQELSRLLGDLDAHWQDRIGRLVNTLVTWADQIEGNR
jgi:hypothetical protein